MKSPHAGKRGALPRTRNRECQKTRYCGNCDYFIYTKACHRTLFSSSSLLPIVLPKTWYSDWRNCVFTRPRR